MKVLIVDDHDYNRDLLKFILFEEGHDCSEAEDGLLAIAEHENDPDIDLILMDVNMPNMDGLSAVQVIRAKEQDRYTPIIFVTALDDVEMLAQCLQAGGDDFVPKPVNDVILLSKISAQMRSRAMFKRVQIMNEDLLRHKAHIEREHAVVEQVFASGVNRVKSRCDNVTQYTSPASLFNGDLVLSSPSPSGGVYVLVGDFTGHGLAAAIGALPVTEIFYSMAECQASVAQMAAEINHRLHTILPSAMFFCASIIQLDPAGKHVSVWSGGMNDILVTPRLSENQHPDEKAVVPPSSVTSLSVNDTNIETFKSAHMPLGVLPPEEFDDKLMTLTLGDKSLLYVFTDGVNEASNLEGEEFGVSRVKTLILERENVVPKIVQALETFQGGKSQVDDISLVEIRAGQMTHRDKLTQEPIVAGTNFDCMDSFPWQYAMHLEGSDLATVDAMHQVLELLSTIKGMAPHQDNLFIILSELFNNALEHGVLDLDSKLKSDADGFSEYYRLRKERLENIGDHFIDVEVKYFKNNLSAASNLSLPNRIQIDITDSGKGFDFESHRKAMEENSVTYGRGLNLLSRLCSSLVFSNGGRTATAVYPLTAA